MTDKDKWTENDDNILTGAFATALFFLSLGGGAWLGGFPGALTGIGVGCAVIFGLGMVRRRQLKKAEKAKGGDQ